MLDNRKNTRGSWPKWRPACSPRCRDIWQRREFWLHWARFIVIYLKGCSSWPFWARRFRCQQVALLYTHWSRLPLLNEIKSYRVWRWCWSPSGTFIDRKENDYKNKTILYYLTRPIIYYSRTPKFTKINKLINSTEDSWWLNLGWKPSADHPAHCQERFSPIRIL